jgi:predicted aldo/keto reductase-like oxidoreductase
LAFLESYRHAFASAYCRHGCTACSGACHRAVPVSTIMRYTYYFTAQGRERHAMSKYSALGPAAAEPCLSCDGDCRGACPHGVNIQANLVRAHLKLSLA